MHRSLSFAVISVALTSLAACAVRQGEHSNAVAQAAQATSSRPGIAIVATGGIVGWEHVTLLDSATARYVTVTRRACQSACAPLDSASGILAAADVARIYSIAEDEHAAIDRGGVVTCAVCGDRAVVTTAVFGNWRRTVIRSDREASPEVLGRVNVALAEAIRASRESGVGNRE